MSDYYGFAATNYDASRHLAPDAAEQAAALFIRLAGSTFLELGVGTETDVLALVTHSERPAKPAYLG